MRYKYIYILLTFFFIVACKEQEKAQTMNGNWQSIGYGWIITIENNGFSLSDLTDISCLIALEGDISDFGNDISLKNDTLTIKDGINIYQFTRLEHPVEVCNDELADEKKYDPIYNFEVLASIFNQHYAYFELRQVNWDSLYHATKSAISSRTTQAELYVILEDMLDSFNDGHIGLNAPKEVEDAADELRKFEKLGEKSGLKSYGDFELAALVADHYLNDKNLTVNSKVMQWGILENNIGYFQVNLMMGHADLNLPDSLKGNAYWRAYFAKFEDMASADETRLELEGLNQALDRVMQDLSNTEAFILDVRFNGGGKDEVALDIIKRFNPERHQVFTKKARHGNGYTNPISIFLEPAESPYLKPVFLLTSQQSASATEIMVLSSLGLDQITRAGAHTEGVFSDVLDKVLPNQWEVGLSNEVYLDNDGQNYEGIGIPAEVDLDYPLDRQSFFRGVANDLEGDKLAVLEAMGK